MSKYIHKLRAPVRLSQPGRDPVDGYFSLLPQAEHHDGPETVLELLNSDSRVIPFVLTAGEGVLLLTRLNIDWVVVGNNVDPRLVSPPAFRVTREERITVEFVDGNHIDGNVQMEMPEGMNRASDFLNGPGDFFPLATRVGTLLINKARVRQTLVHESSPEPVGAPPAGHAA